MNAHSPSQRLVEYFLVVGVESGAADEDGRLKTQVLDRYPEVDHGDVPFPNGVAVFCFPGGGAALCERLEMPRFFEFVSTMNNGTHLYGFVLTIYEELDAALVPQQTAAGRQLYVPKALCLLSHWPFRSQFRTFLTQLYRISISRITMPLERVVANFCSEVPLPPPGRVRVQHSVGDAELVFTRPPANNPISFCDLGFEHVFECLDPDNILKVFSALLTERQVLVRSTQLSLLGAFGEVFRALMYPFRWAHVYIPVLPSAMLMVLQAPLPYLIGIHEEVLQEAFQAGYVIPPTAVVVNLDENTVFASSHELNAMELPVHDLKKLRTRILQCAPAFARRSDGWAAEDLPLKDSAICHAAKPYEIDADTVEHVRKVAQSGGEFDVHKGKSVWCTLPGGECNWPLVRVAFFRFFTSMLRDYREFLIYPVNKPGARKGLHHRTLSRQQREEAQGSFNAAGFLARRKRATERLFLTAFLQTQHFQCFIDDILHPDGARDVDVVFFEQSLSAKFNRTFLTRLLPVMKSETPFLDDRQYSISKTVVANGPDLRPWPLPDEEWMPANPAQGYDKFPPLRRELFPDELRPMPETLRAGAEAYANAPKLRVRNNASMRLGGKAAATSERIESASDAIYATWFVLFCSAIGRGTDYEVLLQNRALGRRSVGSSRHSVASISTDVEDDTFGDAQDPARAVEMARAAASAAASAAAPPSPSRSPSPSPQAPLGPGGSPLPSSGPGSARLQSRLSISSADAEAHKMELTLQQLDVAFEVLEASRRWCNSVRENEVVYRALIDACGRCGHTDYAIRVLGMMHEAGIMADSLVYSNLVQSFSMNGDVSHSLKLDILNWDKLREEVRAANRRIEESRARSRVRSRPRRNSKKAREGDMRGAGLLGYHASSARLAAAVSAPDRVSSVEALEGVGASSRQRSRPKMMRGFSASSSAMPHTPLPSVRRTLRHWGSRHRGEEPRSSGSDTGRNSGGGGRSGDGAVVMGQRSVSAGPGMAPEEPPKAGSMPSSIRSLSSLLFSASRAPGSPLNALTGPGSGGTNVAGSKARAEAQAAMHAPAPAPVPHESMNLDHVFPGLVLDTERETCPGCQKAVSDDEIRRGWNALDANDYSTQCPACGQKFVAFFTCFSPEPTWNGSRGPATPLFCEFLPPWALSKEVRTILGNHDIGFVCTDSFRATKGTLFWNLVLYFSEFSLPIDFLVGPSLEPDRDLWDSDSVTSVKLCSIGGGAKHRSGSSSAGSPPRAVSEASSEAKEPCMGVDEGPSTSPLRPASEMMIVETADEDDNDDPPSPVVYFPAQDEGSRSERVRGGRSSSSFSRLQRRASAFSLDRQRPTIRDVSPTFCSESDKQDAIRRRASVVASTMRPGPGPGENQDTSNQTSSAS